MKKKGKEVVGEGRPQIPARPKKHGDGTGEAQPGPSKGLSICVQDIKKNGLICMRGGGGGGGVKRKA